MPKLINTLNGVVVPDHPAPSTAQLADKFDKLLDAYNALLVKLEVDVSTGYGAGAEAPPAKFEQTQDQG